jgi:chemotaxis protein histidine kinase CheA
MNKLLNLLGMLLVVPCLIGAIEIAEEELERISDREIEFINYEGPHAKIETVEQIKNIGGALATPAAAAEARESERRYAGKYRILHIVAPAEAAGYNADIFILEAGAMVDHIDNVRRILSGYIEATYEINPERAAALAMFTTYYNAIYRGDIKYFREHYSAPVLEQLDPDKVGLSRRYDEWPGSTQIVLPLSQLAGAEAPSAETLSTDEVVEEVRTREDKGVEERKEIVEMREEELEEDRRRLEEERREQVEEQPADQAEEPPPAEPAPGEEEPTSRQSEQPEQSAQPEQPAEEEPDELEAREEELTQREEDIAAERESIAEDQQQLIEEAQQETEQEEQQPAETEARQPAPAAAAEPRTFPFLLFREQNNVLFGRFALVRANGQLDTSSTLNTIRSRHYVDYSGMYVVIAGETTPPRAVRLVGVDTETLEVRQQSETDVYANSPLLEIDNRIYCVISESGSYFIGAFNDRLELENRSEQAIEPYSWLKAQGEYILAQTGHASILRFNLDDLSEAE